MIPAEKQYEFNQLVRIAIHYNKPELGNLAAYIEQSIDVMPPFHDDFIDNRRYICDLFRSPENWDVFEKRLVDILNQTVWHPDNYPPESTSHLTYRYSFIEDLLKAKPSILADIDVFIAHGFTEKEIWWALHDAHYSGSDYDKESAFGQFIVYNAPTYLSLPNLNFCGSESFIKRLIGVKPEIFDTFIDKFMTGTYQNKQYIADISQSTKDYLLQNSDKHEAYLVSLLSFKDDTNNGDYKTTPYILTDLLEANYPNKYDKEIEIYLKKVADKALKDRRQVWANVFDKTLDTLLRYDSADNAFGITSNYLRQFKDINPHNIKLWLKKLKEYDIALI